MKTVGTGYKTEILLVIILLKTYDVSEVGIPHRQDNLKT